MDPDLRNIGLMVKKLPEKILCLLERLEAEKEYSVYIGDREYKVKGTQKLEEIKNLLN